MNVILPTMITSIEQVFKYHLCPVFGRAVFADNCILVEQIKYIDSISNIHMKPALLHAISLCQWLWFRKRCSIKICRVSIFIMLNVYHVYSRVFKCRMTLFFFCLRFLSWLGQILTSLKRHREQTTTYSLV